jgi:hypothetical protein
MKTITLASLLLISTICLQAQNGRSNQPANNDQEAGLTATLKSATRLFGEMDDLTTVIMIIPKDSVVEVLGTDSAYYHVIYQDNEGYILKKHATLNSKPERKDIQSQQQEIQSRQPADRQESRRVQPEQKQRISRFTYLERKYGSNIASRLMAGKIWLGMTAEMVKDSWGSPQKINRVISGNYVKEEWTYNNTWLYIEDDILREWGPVRGSSRP